MNGVEYNGEMPEVFVSHKEKTEMAVKIRSNKPLLLIQTNGGTSKETDKYSWARDMPINTAQKVVNALADKYTIAHIRRPDQLQLHNTVSATGDNFRQLAAVIAISDKRLFIDSFAQHTAAALGLPSVVCWIANIPEQFGYPLHTNIIATPATVKTSLKNSVFSQYNITGPASDFPYNSEDEIFDADAIIAALCADAKQTVIVKEEVAAIQ